MRRHRTQTPIETLNRGWGSCRDLAVLLIEAARGLGFGARVVTGYLCNPSAADGHTTAVTGAGTTHAWADIYLPGVGWIAYDPTNGTIGGGDLIRVSLVTRNALEAISQPHRHVPADEARCKIIREWMSLPKDKRQTEEQAKPFAKKALQNLAEPRP